MFKAAFAEVRTAGDISFVQAANAIAAFEADAFRTDDSPFDRYLESRNPDVLPEGAHRGMALFYGEAGCAACHAGPVQTDHDFHAIAMPQIGPGKGDGADSSYWSASGFPVQLEDRGRYRVTFDRRDLYKFRTPSLRNVALTGPWGHAGAYATLEAVVRHHLDPVASLDLYDPNEAVMPAATTVIQANGDGSTLRFEPINPARLADYRRRDRWVQEQAPLRRNIADANQLPSRALDDEEVDDLLAFLDALISIGNWADGRPAPTCRHHVPSSSPPTLVARS